MTEKPETTANPPAGMAEVSTAPRPLGACGTRSLPQRYLGPSGDETAMVRWFTGRARPLLTLAQEELCDSFDVRRRLLALTRRRRVRLQVQSSV